MLEEEKSGYGEHGLTLSSSLNVVSVVVVFVRRLRTESIGKRGKKRVRRIWVNVVLVVINVVSVVVVFVRR